MNYICVPCDRSFLHDSALQQHKRDSPAHAGSFECGDCHRRFRSEEARAQHRNSPAHANLPVHVETFDCGDCHGTFQSEEALAQHRSSPVHAESFECGDCHRKFRSEEALTQHQKSPAHARSPAHTDSPAHTNSPAQTNSPAPANLAAHAETFDCGDCRRKFRSGEALAQHLQNSPAHAEPVHAESFDCDDCDQAFNSAEALEQHLQTSPAHTKSFDCDDCNRSFRSEDALTQHLRDSPAHQQAPDTPLDVFFRSFRGFAYDPAQPPATSYARLQAHQGWRRGEAASTDAWDRYQEALEGELRLWFGGEDDLAAWHALCHAIGVEPPPQTCHQCEGAVRKTHVNIVDLIEWGRSRGSNQHRVRTFRDVAELREYTVRTRKFFHNTFDEENGNVVLRHLLRKIFRGNL